MGGTQASKLDNKDDKDNNLKLEIKNLKEKMMIMKTKKMKSLKRRKKRKRKKINYSLQHVYIITLKYNYIKKCIYLININ